MTGSLVFSQGTEGMQNMCTSSCSPASSSYTTRTFTGNTSGTSVTATDARTDQTITGGAITIRNGAVTISGISGGVGEVCFDYARVFSGNSVIGLFSGSTQYGSDITVSATTASNVCIDINDASATSFYIERQSGARTIIDNIVWTAYSVPAPVTLTSFKANLDKGAIAINWSTSSEENNDYFSIEHSTDARNYTEFGQVNGAGTTQIEQNYSYVHKTPANGLNYYRLKQIDFDGAFEYSPVQVVEVKRENPISIFPSQAFEKITIDLAEATKEETVIGVYDVMGRMVLSQVLGAEATRSELNIANLSKGHYFIQLQTGNERYTERFIKMN